VEKINARLDRLTAKSGSRYTAHEMGDHSLLNDPNTREEDFYDETDEKDRSAHEDAVRESQAFAGGGGGGGATQPTKKSLDEDRSEFLAVILGGLKGLHPPKPIDEVKDEPSGAFGLSPKALDDALAGLSPTERNEAYVSPVSPLFQELTDRLAGIREDDIGDDPGDVWVDM
jgi:hypothetical protein